MLVGFSVFYCLEASEKTLNNEAELSRFEVLPGVTKPINKGKL